MKHKSVKKITSLLLSGALLAMGTAGIMPAIHASAASNEKVVTDSSTGLKYRYIVNGTNTCILKRVSDNGSDWSMTKHSAVTIPDKIPTTNYTITELGADNEAIIHSSSTGSGNIKLTTLTLPKTAAKINSQALYNTEIPELYTLKLNLNNLTECKSNAMGTNGKLHTVMAYNGSGYSTTNTVGGFNQYYGLASAEYQAMTGDCFKLKNASLNGRLSFLNAVSVTPYCKLVGYEFAKKIAHDNGFDSASLSKQKKLEMVYNYICSHVRYSALYNTQNEYMGDLRGTALSALALNSGVCGSFAHSFEQLSRASGLTVGSTPGTSDVICVGLPGHAANAVRLSASEGYYMVDCTARNFMMTGYYKDPSQASLLSAYVYGIDTTLSEVNQTQTSFSPSQLAGPDFCPGNSFIKIVNNASTNIDIEVYDKNNNAASFIKYTAHPTPAVGSTCYSQNFNVTTDQPLYVSSYVYFGVKVGGVNINMNGTVQNVTINGQTYKVQFRTLNYAQTGMTPKSAYTDDYYLTITKA